MVRVSLLRQLYSIHALTGYEWNIIQFVRQWLDEHVPEVEVRLDKLGNLYITKGEAGVGYPTLACHMDQVQKSHSEDFEVKEDDGKLYGWSEQNQRQEGLGADDKNGIWVCLRCLEECPRLKVFMAVGEEKGCIGSHHADMSFFEDSLYVLEPDCKGGEEVHTTLKEIPCASEEFIEALQLNENGYMLTDGKGTDIFALTLNGIGVSCANIPAGYHHPHKDDEYTIISELEHCLAFVMKTVKTLNCPFQHVYRTATQLEIEKWHYNNF